MARVTATEVKAILDNCTIADDTVDIFIEAGTLVITEVFDGYSDVSDTLLIELERWFVAHMIASTLHRTTDTEKVGDVSVKYTGQWGKNLDLTPYGQMVKQLDTTGKMTSIGMKAASIKAITSFK